eukprot:g10147.t1
MKASYVHAALSVVMVTSMSPSGLAFLTPTAALARDAHLTSAPSNGQGALCTPVAYLASRLAAAREDCKSCMEAELLEEERKRAGMEGEDGGERVAARRAALEEANRREKSRNLKIAFGSFVSAVGLFFFQHSVIAPAQANPVILLRAMETSSAPLATALTNGKPTVVDFYADWCENCKVMAPSMREIEEQFKNQINFVVVDGTAEKNFDLVDAFRVDGIPHLAMVSADGEVETAIIGTVPKDVVVDDIKALLAGRPLPYKGFDMFEGEDHNIKGQIEIDGARRRRERRPELSGLAASGNSPPPEVLAADSVQVRRNLERLRQVELGDTKTVRAITSSALRGKLRLSGRNKRGRVFLPRDPPGGSLETLHRLLKETFPLGDFPVALYVKTSLEEDAERSMLTSDERLLAAISWAEEQGLCLNVCLDVHPDYEEEEAPEWLLDVPDPDLAEEWEMLSFYRFVDIEQPESFANMLQSAWAPLGVRGRVYVASEGVNAQMAVPSTSTERFGRAVEAIEKLAGVYLNKAERRWSGVEFRKDPPFPALHVRARKQIVADGLSRPLEWSDRSGKVGKGLSPEEWHKMMDEEEDVTVLDCRNSYETEVGTFEKAVPLETSFFRESWGELERLVGDADRDAPIMTYCTGGIRCVKIAAYLEQEMGFTNVTRLEGGIVSYSKFAKERGLESKFKGVNYVFDKRMGDKVTGDMLSKCHQCGQPCADHTNCANSCCHARLIQCQSCAAKYEACCSRGCREQRSRQDLRGSLMRRERAAMGLPPLPASGAHSSSSAVGLSSAATMVAEKAATDEREARVPREACRPEGVARGPEDKLMWLVWPFQDPTLNLLFDRAFDEFRDTTRIEETLGAGAGDAAGDAAAGEGEGDCSRMIGIVSRLGGGKRALAVGLGAGGPAGRAGLQRIVEALGTGGELVVVEATPEAASAARGLSLVSGARGCSVRVVVCEEGDMVESISTMVADAEAAKALAAAKGKEGEKHTTAPSTSGGGLFDVILLGGGVGVGDAAELVPDGEEPRGERVAGGEWEGRTPAERLDLVLDRRLVKRSGLVLCDPCALVGGESSAQSMVARATEVKGTVEHARVPGAGPRGGLHIFKWKTYTH